MKFNIDIQENYSLLKLNEIKLTSQSSGLLEYELAKINTAGQKNIILDISSVKFIDSSGLSSLLIGHRLCKDSSGLFIITGVNDNVARLITISQLNTLLSIVPDVDAAIAATIA